MPRYLIAHALQTLDQLTLQLAAIPLLEELLSLFLIFLPCLHHVIIDHENIMAHCQRCSFTASPFFQPKLACSEIRVRATHPMSGLHQHLPHRAISFLTPTGSRRLPALSDLARADTSP